MITEEEDNLLIEENEEGTIMIVSSKKRKAKYIIYKPEDGYGMFRIKQDNGGEVSSELAGSYTSRKLALNTLRAFLFNAKESKEAKWDRMFGEEKAPPLKKKEVKVASAS